MKKAIIKLLDLKSLLSLLFCTTTCYLALLCKISSETFVAITSSIITYYYTHKNYRTIEIEKENIK